MSNVFMFGNLVGFSPACLQITIARASNYFAGGKLSVVEAMTGIV